jgi:ABC-type lipoprotein export system ATPase subunit
MITHEPDIAAHDKRIIVIRDGQVTEDKLSISLNPSLTRGTSKNNIHKTVVPPLSKGGKGGLK